MARYGVFGNAGAANSTAATAGLVKVDNPSASTMAAAKIYEFAVGPKANSADNTYGIQIKRQTTAGTWTAVTPSPLDAKTGASVTTAGVASTAAGSAGVILADWGFHQRGGYRWVSIPGGEFVVPLVFSNGLLIEYDFAQGTDVNGCSLMFDE